MNHIAFLGVGNMGAGMAANLAKSGAQVAAYDLSATALERVYLRKFRLPEPQYMLRDVKIVRYLADCAKSVRRFLGPRPGPMIHDPCCQVVTHGRINGSPPRSTAMRATSFIFFRARYSAIYMRLQHVAGPEHEDPAWQDRHLFAGFWVSTDTPPLLSHRKGPESTDFN